MSWRVLSGMLLTAAAFSGKADLIPLENFIKAPDLYDAQISPDGKYLAFIVNPKNEEQPYKKSLRVMELATNKEVAFLNFPSTQSIESVQWANNERMLLWGSKKYLKFSQPLLNPTMVAVNFDGRKQENIFGPQAGKVDMTSATGSKTNLAMQDYADFDFIRELPETPEFIIGIKTPWTHGIEGESASSIIKLNIYNGKQETLEKLPFKRAGVQVDQNSHARYIWTQSENLETSLYYRPSDSDAFKLVQKYFDGSGRWLPSGFLEDNQKVVIYSNAESDKDSLYTYDPATGNKSLIATDPDGDLESTVWTHDGRHFIGYRTSSGMPSLKLINQDTNEAKILAKLQTALPNLQIEIESATRDGSIAVAYAYSDIEPGQRFLVNLNTGRADRLGATRSILKRDEMASMQIISYKARDGLRIPGYLTLPKQIATKTNLPMVLLVHGGPFGARDNWGFEFNNEAQILSSRGYAVLQVNYRGSSGYGRAHQFGAYGLWGTKMQDDLVDAVNWAVQTKIADEKRVCIMGHSYGGYAAAWGAMRDNVFACAIASMGRYDLPARFDEGDNAQRTRLQAWLKQAIGDDMDELKRRSPVYNAEKLHIPLLLSHGEKDQNVPIENAERLMSALKKANKKYEWMEFEDEHHSMGSEKNQMQFYDTVLKFLEKNIGATAR